MVRGGGGGGGGGGGCVLDEYLEESPGSLFYHPLRKRGYNFTVGGVGGGWGGGVITDGAEMGEGGGGCGFLLRWAMLWVSLVMNLWKKIHAVPLPTKKM